MTFLVTSHCPHHKGPSLSHVTFPVAAKDRPCHKFVVIILVLMVMYCVALRRWASCTCWFQTCTTSVCNWLIVLLFRLCLCLNINNGWICIPLVVESGSLITHQHDESLLDNLISRLQQKKCRLLNIGRGPHPRSAWLCWPWHKFVVIIGVDGNVLCCCNYDHHACKDLRATPSYKRLSALTSHPKEPVIRVHKRLIR